MLKETFGSLKELVSVKEAKVLLGADHLRRVAERFAHSVDYIEAMLEHQLAAAVGKVLQPKDFY